jgi:hypothetical protein
MRIRLVNGRFKKSIFISKFKKKGQIFPQNEINFEKKTGKTEKPKIKKIECNSVSKKLKYHLKLNKK